ncbi:MAG TPA: HAD family hydrolase [Firmicutes bacterium]|nr:HAD family hydrolase [Bacillota bacterium]
MFRALLFDLDGTLLSYDTDAFLQKYMELLARRVSEFVDPSLFLRQLLRSTEAMVRNLDPSKTNKDVFMEDFFPGIGIPPEVLMPVFDDFYRKEFLSLKSLVRPVPLARPLVEQAVRSGLDVVIATNPVFPMVAIRERLRWGHLDDLSYRLVTSYEVMHYCKPNREYYEEVLSMIGRRPCECLMIGNDVDEDLAAGAAGIRTYLVTDCLRGKQDGGKRPDFCGTFQDLADFLKQVLGMPVVSGR